MKIGYARVSTKDQNLDLQINALKNINCEEIFEEKQSAVKSRPVLEEMINKLRKGDIVVVWKLDRLGRSLKHLIELVSIFNDKGVEFISISDNIDTTTTIQGRLVFNLFASISEFERELISERTRAGLKAAMDKGVKLGRPKGLNKQSKQKALAAHQLAKAKKQSVSTIIKTLGISKATFYRYLDYVDKELNERAKKKRKK